MTEERMIRLRMIPPKSVRWELYFYDDEDESNYHPHTGDMSIIELAPPKDWNPYCYDESKKICSMIGLVNDPPKCWKDCPFRKKD